MSKCQHKNIRLEIVIDRTTNFRTTMVLDGKHQPAMKAWADNHGFKTTKWCVDCGETL